MNAFIFPTRATAAGRLRRALSIGLALAATSIAAQVEGLVPPGDTATAFGPGLAGIVAQAARCERVSVDGSSAEKGTIAQIGINLVSPDGTGDINNHTVMYVTDSWRLAEQLLRFGLPVRLDLKLVYQLTPAASALELFVQVDAIAGALNFVRGKFSHAVMTVTLAG